MEALVSLKCQHHITEKLNDRFKEFMVAFSKEMLQEFPVISVDELYTVLKTEDATTALTIPDKKRYRNLMGCNKTFTEWGI